MPLFGRPGGGRSRRGTLERESFGLSYAGQAGERKTLKYRPQTPFTVEKFQATDDSPNPGYGTRILSVYVGNALQRPAPPTGGTLTAFFAPNALGNEVRWDRCDPAIEISIEVSFDVACTWDSNITGWYDEPNFTEIE